MQKATKEILKKEITGTKLRRKKAISNRLDNNKELVGGKEKNKTDFSVQIEQLKEYAGSCLCTEKDYNRGYTSISKCGKTPIDLKTNVALVQGVKGNLYFNGLLKCKSVWRCPVCAYKISKSKQKQINFLNKELTETSTNYIDTNKGITPLDIKEIENKKGYQISFLTLTLRHKKTDLLKRRLDDILSEFRKYTTTSIYRKLKKENNIIGIIKRPEITFSFKNGWHPHLHILIYHKSPNLETLEKFHKEIIKNWVKRQKIGGLIRANDIKLVNSIDDKVTKYLTKWNIGKEMTNNTSKKNLYKNKLINQKRYDEISYSPFEILKKLTFNLFDDFENKKRFEGLYMTYCNATYKRHFCTISRQLKEYLIEDTKYDYELLDKTDEQAVCDDEVSKVITYFHPNLWSDIIKRNSLNKKIILAYKKNKLKGILTVLKKQNKMRPYYDSKRNLFRTKNKIIQV